MLPSPSDGTAFEPVFVVGSQRSGTTLLAVLLDRHSGIAIPPETHFFGHFRRHLHRRDHPGGHQALIDEFFRNRRAADMNLEPSAFLNRFRRYPANLPHLLRAALEQYGASRGKPRPGEKTPSHLEFVPLIIQWFPGARVVCIVRDGRAAVLSAAKLGWYKGDIVGLSLKWRRNAARMMRFERRFPHQFTRVRYEDLLRHPRRVLSDIDRFIGIPFEESQFDTSVRSDLIPEWEGKWKGKSGAELDATRLDGWRDEVTAEENWLMKLLMGTYLDRLNYLDTEVSQRVTPQLLRYAAGRMAFSMRTYLRRLLALTRARGAALR
jgi:hypothetical protein